MAFDPLACLGGMFFAGITRKTDDEDMPIWRRALAGTFTAIVVAGVSGIAGGYVSGQIVLREHEIKIGQIKERQTEDRAEIKGEIKDVSLRLRDLELRRTK